MGSSHHTLIYPLRVGRALGVPPACEDIACTVVDTTQGASDFLVLLEGTTWERTALVLGLIPKNTVVVARRVLGMDLLRLVDTLILGPPMASVVSQHVALVQLFVTRTALGGSPGIVIGPAIVCAHRASCIMVVVASSVVMALILSAIQPSVVL